MEPEPKISMELIREMLEDVFTIDYECNYCRNRANKEKPSTSRTQKPKTRKPKSDRQYVCFFCGQLGHIKKNCVKYQKFEKSKIKT
ncbi:MAG TPA: hypothetical protein VEQ18_02565, partial [Candidatus Nitrosocosmicus sp.]|nr:hypothetical protein [Candidatus Nitrosocosmicus sp.]